MLPLEGLKIVSLEQAIAAPFASRQLADLGARVIKIERPVVGDFARNYDEKVKGMSSHFVWTNRSKESLTLNLKADSGKDVFEELIKDADVFIQNLAPGAVERLGFGNDYLQQLNSKLIICNISGYGSKGSYMNKKAYDLLIQCEAGFLSVTGTEETPSKAGISVADIAAGMYAYSGILSSIIKRSRTGSGEVLDISMLEALGEWMGFPLYYSLYSDIELKRTGAQHASIYPYGPFETAGNETVFFAIQNEREWKNFCESILQTPELAFDERYSSNSRRVENKADLKEKIEQVLKNKDLDTVMKELEENKIANAQLKNMKQFAEHSQLTERERWFDVGSPVGNLKALLPPTARSKEDVNVSPIPNIGEHTNSILKELGLSEDKIKQFRDSEVI